MLWMVKTGHVNRTQKFLEDGIIAADWGIGDLTGCSTKEDIENIIAQTNSNPGSVKTKVGFFDRFINQIKIGHYCIVPCDEVFYTGIIKSEYYFEPDSQKYEHQRKVEWLFDGEPQSRYGLPIRISMPFGALGIIDISKYKSEFFGYLNREHGIEVNDLPDESNEVSLIENELNSLVIDAIKIIKDEINSDDPIRRLKAAVAVMILEKNKER